MRLWTILYGTRPEAVKLAPILREFRRRGHAFRLICSDQHTTLLQQTATLDPAFADADHLQIPSEGWPPHYAIRVARALQALADPIEYLIVQGDTSTAYGGSLIGAHLYHVEAGVRTYKNDPDPEEPFRVAIDAEAGYGACATYDNRINLAFGDGRVHGHGTVRNVESTFPVTGNPGIDQLYHTVQPTTERTDTVLITLHRRESHGPYLEGLARGIVRLAERFTGLSFLWPVHPNPAVGQVTRGLPRLPNLCLTDPMPPDEFTRLLATAHAVITDSGGVQEEAAALGIPALIARPHTDRPESIATGSALLLGDDPAALPDLFPRVERLSREPNPCFGDGHAAPRILDHLENL